MRRPQGRRVRVVVWLLLLVRVVVWLLLLAGAYWFAFWPLFGYARAGAFGAEPVLRVCAMASVATCALIAPAAFWRILRR